VLGHARLKLKREVNADHCRIGQQKFFSSNVPGVEETSAKRRVCAGAQRLLLGRDHEYLIKRQGDRNKKSLRGLNMKASRPANFH
jgi:hypothetical protein